MTGQWKTVRLTSDGSQVVEPERYRYIVFHPYMGPTEISRYRNCKSIGCGKSFKFKDEDDWTCPDCRKQRAEVERRHSAEGALFNANARIKP